MKTTLLRNSLLALFAAAPLSRAAVVNTNTWALTDLTGADTTGSSTLDGQLGLSVGTSNPSGINGSTSYVSSTGATGTGAWITAAGTAVTIPAQDWGFETMFRFDGGAIAVNDWREVFNLSSDVGSNALTVELKNVAGTMYLEVNRSGLANLINPRISSAVVAGGTWYDIALVKTGSTLNLYSNGTLIGSSSATGYLTDGRIGLGFLTGNTTKSSNASFSQARMFTFASGQFNPATDLYITAVPESSVYGLTGAGTLAGIAFVRRRRKVS